MHTKMDIHTYKNGYNIALIHTKTDTHTYKNGYNIHTINYVCMDLQSIQKRI